MSELDDNAKDIGSIGNYYGGLSVSTDGDKFYWSIENWDGHNWKEISESLYNSLIREDSEEN